jgi:D-aminoacyl-tRNA deacylase
VTAPVCRTLLVESTQDPASVGIAAAIRGSTSVSRLPGTLSLEALERFPGVLLARSDTLHLESEAYVSGLDRAGVKPQAIVFLSKHKAASGRPALTVHPVGNLGEALYGGRPGKLGPTAPALQSELLRALAHRARTDAYPAEVTFEVTHHGPLLEVPSCFLELGSGPEQWTDPRGARVVAHALLDVLSRPLPDHPVAVGVGGGHYAPRFTEAALTKQVHFGHLVPTHAAETIEDAGAMLRQAIERSPGAGGVYFHRKNLPRPVLERWALAARAETIASLDSGAWPSVLGNS